MAYTTDYPWTSTPLIVSAPMRLISTPPLALEVSRAGGLGFIGGGTDLSTLEAMLADAAAQLEDKPIPSSAPGVLPLGVGFLNWGADLEAALPALQRFPPAAVWFFAPRETRDLRKWTEAVRGMVKPQPKIWIQVGTVAEAREVCEQNAPDVLVVQGNDAGGHGLQYSAGIISLLPEVVDHLDEARELGSLTRVPQLIAAGGIMDGRGSAAALALGAQGVVLGTRFLASPEANIAQGYRGEVVRASDGGKNTVRSSVYDYVRGTPDWPERFGGRGVINASYTDWMNGMDKDENRRRYEDTVKLGDAGWGPEGRMCTYAGTGVGLIKSVKPAADITREVREQTLEVLKKLKA